MLDHYYQAKGNSDLVKAASKDWVDILSGFPAWAIGNACHAWLISDKCQFKPLPGQITKLIEHEMIFIRDIEVGLRATEKRIDEQKRLDDEAKIEGDKNADN